MSKQTEPDNPSAPAAATPSLALPGVEASPLAAERLRLARMQSNSLRVIATGGVLTLMYVARPVLVLVLTSLLIAFILAPIVELGQKLRLPRWLGAFVAVTLMCLTLAVLFQISYKQADDFAGELPKYSGKIRSTLRQLQQRAERVRQTTRDVLPEEKSEKAALTVRQAPNLFEQLTSSASAATEILVLAAFMPFLVFFMLSWQEHVRSATVLLFGQRHHQTAYVTLGLIAQMIRAFLVGNLIIGVLLGAISTVAFWILGVPYFYVIGLISGALSLLPYLGIVLAVLPPLLVGLGTLTAKGFFAVFAVVSLSHVVALNLFYPKIIGNRLQLNPLAVTLSLLFWGWLWGAMGLILAVPLTATFKIICDHVEGLQPWGNWLGE